MSSRSWLTRAGVALLGTTTAVGVFAAPAQAASTGVASVNANGKLTVKAASGKVNNIGINQHYPDTTGRIIVDDRVALKAGKGCQPVEGDKTRVTCTGVTHLSVSLGDRDDRFYNYLDLPGYIYGGSGDDKLYGGDGRDELHGGPGNDYINGRPGNDKLYGDSGNDEILGYIGNDQIWDGSGNDRAYGSYGNDVFHDGPGKDRFNGGDSDDVFLAGSSLYADRYAGGNGVDTIDYSGLTKAVKASADGTANDGRAGEKDNIDPYVENITGGRGNDTLYGTNGANVLQGGPGNDTLHGRGGADTLVGGSGRDHLSGGAGNDQLIGDPGVNHDTEKLYADVLLGGSGVDTVDYHAYYEPVIVDLDGAKGDDGVKGEKDTVGADVENAIGGYGSDTITGNNANNVLDGGGEGADILRGLGGDDKLYSDNQPAGISDEQVDRLDGGTHVNGDFCARDAEDIAVNCELN